MQFKSKYIWTIVLLSLCLGCASALERNISVPEEVVIGRWFSVNVSVSSEEPVNFTVYSYVYDGLNNVGQGWTENRKEISLGSGEQTEFVLEDLVRYGTEEGWYNLRVRFKIGDGNITDTFRVKVIEDSQSFAFKETYLYLILVGVCIIGVFLAFKFNR